MKKLIEQMGEKIRKLRWACWIKLWVLAALFRGAWRQKKAFVNDNVEGLTTYFRPNDISVIGDSSANHLAQRMREYTRVTNFARNGSTIEDWMDSPILDGQHHVVVLAIGGNDIGLLGKNVVDVMESHYELFLKIKAEDVIVIGLSPVNGTEGFAPHKNSVIRNVNYVLKLLYRDNFIDTWPPMMLPSFTDGVHHTLHYDKQIIEAVKDRILAIYQKR